jgi:hypothetical protein
MSAWEVIPCLFVLRSEFNLVSPKRDKGADGTIGDNAHNSSSDHSADEDSSVLRNKDVDKKNEVHALDIDSTGPWPDGKPGHVKGSWFDRKIKQIIAEEKRRWLDPDDMCRLNYVIWNGYIYDKDEDFAPVKYEGDDPHTNHAHFSGRYETRAESDTRSWGVYTPPKPPAKEIPVDQATFNKLMDGWAATANGKRAIGTAVMEAKIPSKEVPQRDVQMGLGDLFNQLRPALVFPADHPENKTSGLPTSAPILAVLGLPARVAKIEQAVSLLTAKLTS